MLRVGIDFNPEWVRVITIDISSLLFTKEIQATNRGSLLSIGP